MLRPATSQARLDGMVGQKSMNVGQWYNQRPERGGCGWGEGRVWQVGGHNMSMEKEYNPCHLAFFVNKIPRIFAKFEIITA